MQAQGYEVVALPDGVAGLDAVWRETFDLVVTNKSLPRMTGDEMAWRIRKRYPAMPILHMGAQSLDDIDNYPLGTYHLLKPFDTSRLRWAVHDILHHQSPHLPQTGD